MCDRDPRFSKFTLTKAAPGDADEFWKCGDKPKEGCAAGRAKVALLIMVLGFVMERVNIGASDFLDYFRSFEVAGDSEGAASTLLAVRAVADAIDLGFARNGD